MSLSNLRIGQMFVAGDTIYFKAGSNSICQLWSRQRFRVNPKAAIPSAQVLN